MVATAKLTLALEARSRAHDATLFKLLIGDPSNVYGMAATAAGREYYGKVKGNPRHNEGPPHIHIAGALLNTCATDHNISATEKTPLTQVGTEYSTPQLLDSLIKVARVSKTYKKDYKLMLGFTFKAQQMGLSDLMEQMLTYSGMQVKTGEASRGPHAREIREILGTNNNMGEEEE